MPARNTLFLSYALAWAEVVGDRDIWLGVNAEGRTLACGRDPECVLGPEFGLSLLCDAKSAAVCSAIE